MCRNGKNVDIVIMRELVIVGEMKIRQSLSKGLTSRRTEESCKSVISALRTKWRSIGGNVVGF